MKVSRNALVDAANLPGPDRGTGAIHLEQIARLREAIGRLVDGLEAPSWTDADLRRPCAIRGFGPVAALAPDLDAFDGGRDFPAWSGLVLRQPPIGAGTRLGAVGKAGRTDIRRPLIVGAMGMIRWVVRRGGGPNRWPASLVAGKPKRAAATLADEMARMIWAMTTKQEDCRMA